MSFAFHDVILHVKTYFIDFDVSWLAYSVLVILIFGCMMMDLMRKKVKITLRETYGERFSRDLWTMPIIVIV